MIRTLYRWLLWLHPPAFRREFAGEMLWIFEEAAAEGIAPLFADGVVSLLRQWLLRSGQWKIAAAVIGGLVEVSAGGLGALTLIHARAERLPSAQMTPGTPAELLAMTSLVHIVLWAATGVVLLSMALVLWVASLNGKRLRSLSVTRRQSHAAWSRR